MAKITFIDKVENEGITDEGKVFADDMNEIKNVINTNEDLRLTRTPASGVYSSTLQSLQFKNAANTVLFNISLADLVTGGGGISDAPSDNNYYARRNYIWEAFTPGISDAPSNSNIYGRSGGGWVVLTLGISDAPKDGVTYARKDGAWITIGSGGGGVTVHNELSNRDSADCHPISSITNLQTSLTNLQTSLTNLQNSLNEKATISSITNLQTSLTNLQNSLNEKASLAGNINQDFSAKTLTVGNNIILNGRTLTIRTL